MDSGISHLCAEMPVGTLRLQEAAAALDYHAQEPNFTLAMASLTARLQEAAAPRKALMSG